MASNAPDDNDHSDMEVDECEFIPPERQRVTRNRDHQKVKEQQETVSVQPSSPDANAQRHVGTRRSFKNNASINERAVIYPSGESVFRAKKLHDAGEQDVPTRPQTRSTSAPIRINESRRPEHVQTSSSSSSSSSSSDEEVRASKRSYEKLPKEGSSKKMISGSVKGYSKDVKRKKVDGETRQLVKIRNTYYDHNGRCMWPDEKPTLKDMVKARLKFIGKYN